MTVHPSPADFQQHGERKVRLAAQMANLLYAARSRLALTQEALRFGEGDKAAAHAEQRRIYTRNLRMLINRHDVGREAFKLAQEWESRNVQA